MALLSSLASITIWFCLRLLLANSAVIKEFLHMGQSLRTSDTHVSFSGNFELGFFSRNRDDSTKYYVGIWFKMVPKDKIVWVANRVNEVATASDDSKRWITLQSSKCGTNKTCGAFTICSPENIDPCDCLTGFKPVDEKSWIQGNRSAGCVRETELACSSNTTTSSSDGNDNKKQDGFLRLLTIVDLSSNADRFKINTVLLCERACSSSCSCVAYAYDYNGGTCYLWTDHVYNLKNIPADDQSNTIKVSFYLRLAASELLTNGTLDGKKATSNDSPKRDNRSRDMLLIVLLIPFLTLLVLGLFVYKEGKIRKK